MKQGDFTSLAKLYKYRPGYSYDVLQAILGLFPKDASELVVGDVGAGTGKLTEMLIEMNLKGFAVEPNDEMRKEGEETLGRFNQFKWIKGSGEKTNLEDNSCNWVIMASSFHWTDPVKSLPEFHRILRPGGLLTVVWNPRNLELPSIHTEIEEEIFRIAPGLKRKSSGAKSYTSDMEKTLLSTQHFTNCIFMEAQHNVDMSKDRFLGVWKSVNDIQAQMTVEQFNGLLTAIEKKIDSMETINCPYKTRSWTVRVKK